MVFKSTGSFSVYTYSVPTTNVKGAMVTPVEYEFLCFSQRILRTEACKCTQKYLGLLHAKLNRNLNFSPLPFFLCPSS